MATETEAASPRAAAGRDFASQASSERGQTGKMPRSVLGFMQTSESGPGVVLGVGMVLTLGEEGGIVIGRRHKGVEVWRNVLFLDLDGSYVGGFVL